MIYLLSFSTTLFLSLIFTALLIKLANHFGFVVEPREDRWHKKPVALFGGVGIFIAFLISFILFVPKSRVSLGLIACSGAIFILGLVDDLYDILPQIKFVVQVLIAIAAVIFGIHVKIIHNPAIAIPLTILWIVGITNAINILDNMDGLSSGITFISASCILLYTLQQNLTLVALLSIILVGSSLGFLRYNFKPAKIFMGDCGSLFLGFMLAIITILGTWKEATNLLATLLVPITIMLVPIFDTALVTFTRVYNGRPIFQGGKDHSSHRLVFLGFSEKKAVLMLMAISLVFGAGTTLFLRINFFITLIILVVFAVCLLFFGIFLSEITIYGKELRKKMQNRNSVINSILLYKKQILQVIVDIILISIAYFSSYFLRFEGIINNSDSLLIQQSLPVIIFIKISIFTVFGLYKEEWRYVSIDDLIRIFKGISIGSLFSVLGILALYRFHSYSKAVFVIDCLLTFLLIAGVRVLIRVYKEYFSTNSLSTGIPILIAGAGDRGELLLREIKNNPSLNYKPVGFIDDDREKLGKIINGFPVLGSRKDIQQLIQKYNIKKIFISIYSSDEDLFKDIFNKCQKFNVECKKVSPIIKISGEI